MNKKTIYSNKAPEAIGPYSQAVKINNLIYTSGMIAINPENGEMVQDSIENETKQVLINLQNLLASENLNFSHVIKSSIFIMDMKQFGKINEVYAQFFTESLPARETVQVAGLPKNANIEISLVVSCD